MSIHPSKTVRPARAAFIVDCRVEPTATGELHLSFFPPLPNGLMLGTCPRGGLLTRLERLGRVHGVTVLHRAFRLPRALYPAVNTIWGDPAWAFLLATMGTAALFGKGSEKAQPYGGPRNEGDQVACAVVWP
ncbi:hypothetical protein [Deinococcus yunweiensis]|uniref:hypothetical protein n=1 Tax=Deinococcus yunweiensis TaxID=367282 RepID=UPI00398E476F